MYELFELDNGFKLEFKSFNIILRDYDTFISFGITRKHKGKYTQINYIDIETEHFCNNFHYFKIGDFLSFKSPKITESLRKNINQYDTEIKELLLSMLYKKTRD